MDHESDIFPFYKIQYELPLSKDGSMVCKENKKKLDKREKVCLINIMLL